MSEEALEDKKFLEQKLDKALDEAWGKVGLAVDGTPVSQSDLEMTIRLAAEAVEYSSALFSLTFALEDFDPTVEVDKKAEPMVLVKRSLEKLKKARELRSSSTQEAYTSLRRAADYLKTAYLNQTKKSRKRTS